MLIQASIYGGHAVKNKFDAENGQLKLITGLIAWMKIEGARYKVNVVKPRNLSHTSNVRLQPRTIKQFQ